VHSNIINNLYYVSRINQKYENKMKTALTLLLTIMFWATLHGQKQSTPYFEFTYNCNKVDSEYNAERKSWSYLFLDEINELVITVHVKINPRNEEYPRELLDAAVGDYGLIKTTIGSFKGIYAAITIIHDNREFIKMATFSTKKKTFIVSVIGTDKELVLRKFTQIEKSFITI
jgi:hypothetical protein